MREHPDYGLAFGQAYVYNSDLSERLGSDPIPSETNHPEWSLKDMLRAFPQIGTVVIRRAVAEKVRFDLSLRLGEDWDWVLTVAEQYLVGYVDTPVLMYRTRESHKLHWGIVRQTTVVFNRHLRSFSFTERLRLKPVLWQRRGWYAWSFLEQVGEYRQQRRYRLAAKAMWNAVRTSPLHTAKLLARSARAKALRPRAAQLVPVAPGPEEGPVTATKQ